MANADKHVSIRIDTEAELAEARVAKEAIDQVKESAEKTNNTSLLEKARNDLNDAVNKIPILGQTLEALSNPIGAAAGGLAAFGALAQQQVSKAIDLADRLQDMAERFEVSASALQGLGNVASQNGSNLDAIGQALNKLTTNGQAAAEGSKSLAEAFERLGITQEEFANLSADQMFLRISDAVATSTDRNRTYADVVAVMGREAGQLFSTLSKGSVEINKQADAIGRWSDAQIDQLARAKDSIEALTNKLTIAAGWWASNSLELFEAITGGGKLTEEQLNKVKESFDRQNGVIVEATQSAGDFAEKQKEIAEETSKATTELQNQASAAETSAKALEDLINRTQYDQSDDQGKLDLLKKQVDAQTDSVAAASGLKKEELAALDPIKQAREILEKVDELKKSQNIEDVKKAEELSKAAKDLLTTQTKLVDVEKKITEEKKKQEKTVKDKGSSSGAGSKTTDLKEQLGLERQITNEKQNQSKEVAKTSDEAPKTQEELKKLQQDFSKNGKGINPVTRDLATGKLVMRGEGKDPFSLPPDTKPFKDLLGPDPFALKEGSDAWFNKDKTSAASPEQQGSSEAAQPAVAAAQQTQTAAEQTATNTQQGFSEIAGALQGLPPAIKAIGDATNTKLQEILKIANEAKRVAEQAASQIKSMRSTT